MKLKGGGHQKYKMVTITPTPSSGNIVKTDALAQKEQQITELQTQLQEVQLQTVQMEWMKELKNEENFRAELIWAINRVSKELRELKEVVIQTTSSPSSNESEPPQ